MAGEIILFLIALIIGLSLLIGIYFFLQSKGVIEKGGVSFSKQIPWIEIGLYFVMVAGMASKYVYSWSETRKKFKIRSLLRPICVSPIVFGYVYTQIDAISSLLPLFILAFQNGFFWQTILGQKTPFPQPVKPSQPVKKENGN
jgi:hypothetical protein